MPAVSRREASGFGGCRVEAGQGFLNKAVQGGDADLVRNRGDVLVHERRALSREPHGLLGDPSGLPRRQVSVHHPRQQPRQPVVQLDRLTEIETARVGRQAQDRGELRDTELRDLRCAGARDGMSRSPQPWVAASHATEVIDSRECIAAHTAAYCSLRDSARSDA